MALALADWLDAQRLRGWVFFDRGLVDAASALQNLTGDPVLERIGPLHRYHRRVFFAPPWREIYTTDVERQHILDEAIGEYDRLLSDYPSLGYEVVILPKVSISDRADFILDTLGTGPAGYFASQR